MKIIIAGKNNIAISVTEWLINYDKKIEVFVLFNQNDQGENGFQRSFKKYCHEKKLQEISLNDAYRMEGAIFLSLEYDKIIAPEKFSHDKVFNIHFSLLPQYKGMYTSAWPILNGEEKSGVTLHCIDSGIDTGDIIDQISFQLEENETAKSLYLKYIRFGTELVIKNLPSLIAGNFVKSKQSAKKSTYYSKKSINYNQLNIDYNQTAEKILQQVRAYSFRDYQLPSVQGSMVFHGKILDKKTNEKPGRIIFEDDSQIILSTIDYDLCLFKDKLEDFLNLCREGNVKAISNHSNKMIYINEKNEQGWSPVIVAAYYGRIDMIEKLVELGANINDTNNNGTTVAMYYKSYMSKSKDYSGFKRLFALGADLSLKDFNGLTVIDYLEKGNDRETLNFIKGYYND